MPGSLITPVQLPQFANRSQVAAIASPAQYYLSASEHLQITVFNSLVGVTVALQGRLVDPQGNPKPIDASITPTADRMPSTVRVAVGESLISSLIVSTSIGAPRVGQTFVQVNIIQGLEGAVKQRATLIQGYVTQQQTRAFPGSPIENSLDGGGYVRQVNGTAPAPQNDWIETVPSGARWNLLSVFAQLHTDATPGDRTVAVQLDNGSAAYVFSPAPAPAHAGVLTNFAWSTGLPLATQLMPSYVIGGLPTESPMLAGYRVGSISNPLAAGDQWGAPRLLVREWIEAT
jgi:hypothetical protein